MWQYNGSRRPDFAEAPSKGQESVWDYPRPPSLRRLDLKIEVNYEGSVLAKSTEALCVSETASPPVFYISFANIVFDLLWKTSGSSFCEWKGKASYWGIKSNSTWSDPVAWSYEAPLNPYEKLKNHLAFYPSKVDCYLDGEKVTPQPGGFYGGWLTTKICGPVKGDSGTEWW